MIVHVEVFVEGHVEKFHDEVTEDYAPDDLKEDYCLEGTPHTILTSCNCPEEES